jgi:hypothetical protein
MGDEALPFQAVGKSDCLVRRKGSRYLPASQRAVQNNLDRSDSGDSKGTLKPEDVIATPSKSSKSSDGDDCRFAAPTVTEENAAGDSRALAENVERDLTKDPK